MLLNVERGIVKILFKYRYFKDLLIDIDINIFQKCRYIDNRYVISIYRSGLALGEAAKSSSLVNQLLTDSLPPCSILKSPRWFILRLYSSFLQVHRDDELIWLTRSSDMIDCQSHKNWHFWQKWPFSDQKNGTTSVQIKILRPLL